MNALKTIRSKGRVHTPLEHLHPLERQQRYLSTLFGQLNSYQCVPKTEELHRQIEVIRSAFRKLLDENESLINSLQKSKESDKKHQECYESQFRKMQQLERSVLEYIGKARIHS